MSLKDKMKSLIGIDDTEYYEEEEFVVPEIEPPVNNVIQQPQQPPQPHLQVQPAPAPRQERPAAPEPVRQPQPKQILRAVEPPKQTKREQVSVLNTNNIMNKVIIREPKEFNDAQYIADCLKEGLPVFVNLQRLDRGDGRRVIDFLSGTIYAVDGDIQSVGNDLFLCTPKSVQTEGEVSDTQSELGFVD